MPEVASLTQAFVFLILIVPGFITFRLISWSAAYEFEYTDLQTTLWSLIFSVIDFIPFASIFQFQSIPDLESKILQPTVILTYFAIASGIGLGVGKIIHREFRRNMLRGSVWKNFAIQNLGDWVHVYTTNGNVYKGWIKMIATHKSDPREIELGEPKLLETGMEKKTWKPIGNSILFTEKDILRIVLLK